MVISGRHLLSGTVEVDEVYIGSEHSGKRGHGAEKSPFKIVSSMMSQFIVPFLQQVFF